MIDLYTSIADTIIWPEQAEQQRAIIYAEGREQLRTGHRPARQYRKLLWQMEDLPGTTWRNLWIATEHTVLSISLDRWDRPGPDYDGTLFSIGCYRGEGRFEIDDWIRVDHLPPEVQIAWAIERVRHLKADTAEVHRRKRDMSDEVHRVRVHYLARDVEEATRRLLELADQYGVTINQDDTAIENEQLRLFI